MPAAAATRQKIFFAFSAVAPATPLTIESLKANPLVPGVSVISEGPAKGHSCFDEANQQVVPMWIDAVTLQTVVAASLSYTNGLRVNAGHFTAITEAAARLNAFRVEGPKLRADMLLFRTYSQFDHLCELIATIPDTFGLSIDFSGPAEIRDGKGFARCEEIFSCDLVPSPAANEGGLFSADLPPAVLAQLHRLFDNARVTNPMADPTNPPGNPTPPPNPPPAAPDNNKNITDAITAALGPALEAAMGPIKTDLSALTQRVTALETASKADEAEDTAVDTSVMPAAMKRLRKEVNALSRQFGETGQKLARRFGLEFAARAGANPIEAPAGGSGAAAAAPTRQAFEVPSDEVNATALAGRPYLKG
ncbi:MAG TPA: hypothetical protein VGL72_11450 [Bryobacteraceae bacterium]|jgi:hypothetical protein